MDRLAPRHDLFPVNRFAPDTPPIPLAAFTTENNGTFWVYFDTLNQHVALTKHTTADGILITDADLPTPFRFLVKDDLFHILQKNAQQLIVTPDTNNSEDAAEEWERNQAHVLKIADALASAFHCKEIRFHNNTVVDIDGATFPAYLHWSTIIDRPVLPDYFTPMTMFTTKYDDIKERFWLFFGWNFQEFKNEFENDPVFRDVWDTFHHFNMQNAYMRMNGVQKQHYLTFLQTKFPLFNLLGKLVKGYPGYALSYLPYFDFDGTQKFEYEGHVYEIDKRLQRVSSTLTISIHTREMFPFVGMDIWPGVSCHISCFPGVETNTTVPQDQYSEKMLRFLEAIAKSFECSAMNVQESKRWVVYKGCRTNSSWLEYILHPTHMDVFERHGFRPIQQSNDEFLKMVQNRKAFAEKPFEDVFPSVRNQHWSFNIHLSFREALFAMGGPECTGWFIKRVFNHEFEQQELLAKHGIKNQMVPSYPTYRKNLQDNTASAAHYADSTHVAER